jgi:hypothetical protein
MASIRHSPGCPIRLTSNEIHYSISDPFYEMRIQNMDCGADNMPTWDITRHYNVLKLLVYERLFILILPYLVNYRLIKIK